MNDIWPQLAAKRINLAEEQDFELGGMRVVPASRAVEMNGERIELQPRVMQVLIALAQARPGVVSREKLIELCWEGRIVGDDALNRCILALRHVAQRFTPSPFAIETVPRVGHRLVECPGDGGAHAERPKPIRSWRLLPGMAAILLLTSFGGVLWWQQHSVHGEPASIAVLPFRNLSAGDPYFAQGVGEEILGQLAREPQFRVAGSSSSSGFGEHPDVRAAARALNVDYVVEGSVRRQGDQVRVNADLLRAKDGVRLWSDSYDGKLDDILQIQGSIGQAVADGLKRKLVFAGERSTRPVNGQAYALYLNARGLVRSGNPQSGHEAVMILKEAIRIDPAFAPSWASLAAALELQGRTNGNEGMIAAIPQGLAAARQALRLDPNLAEAHAVYADFVGKDSLEGIAHMRRAGVLEPSSGEGTMRRGAALHASGNFPAAYREFFRAHQLDPLWSTPTRSIGDNKALVGDRQGAQAYARREYADDPALQDFALARVAWFTGDFSEAVRLWSQLAQGQSQWSSPSKLSRENALYLLKLSTQPPSRPPRPSIGQNRMTPANVWMAAPSAVEWQRRNRSAAAELVYRDENVVAAKLMLNAGRASELVRTYDSPTGLLGIRRGVPVGTCYLQNAALVALALRATARNNEAEEILRQSDAAIRAAYARGIVPTWFDDDAAGIWAVQGKSDLAADALDRALRRGSAHATRTDLPTLTDEPALRSLRGNPRFEAVAAKYRAHYARERLETAQALRIRAT